MKMQILLGFAFLLSLLGHGARAQVISVSGYVLDEKGKPVEHAKVLVIPVDTRVNPVATTTDKDGYYRVGLRMGAELDVVFGSKGRQVALNRLVGHRDQFVSKVLAPASTSAQYVFGYLQAIEYVGFFSQSNEQLLPAMRQAEILPTRDFISTVVNEVPFNDKRRDLITKKYEWMQQVGLLDFLK